MTKSQFMQRYVLAAIGSGSATDFGVAGSSHIMANHLEDIKGFSFDTEPKPRCDHFDDGQVHDMENW